MLLKSLSKKTWYKNLLKKIKSNKEQYAKLAIVGMLCAALILSTMYCLLNFSQIHRNYIRHRVGDNVVKVVVTDESNTVLGGGTGFMINSPHGNQYILTNAHVCEAFSGSPTVNVQLKDGKIIPRNILEISNSTDLCLVEGIPGYAGMNLADGLDIGEEVMLVGHPRLLPLTIVSGEIIADMDIRMINGIIGLDISEEDCQKPKNEIVTAGYMHICFTRISAQMTTLVSLGGNSGSPVVNWWGNVVGILFASDSDANWGAIITLKDIRTFLRPY